MISESDRVLSNESLGTGLRFVFDIDGVEIVYVCSAYTGKERMFINGELVAEKTSFKTESSLTTVIENKIYSVDLAMESMFSSGCECRLLVNNQVVEEQVAIFEMISYKSRPGLFILMLVTLFTAFFGIDYVVDLYDLGSFAKVILVLILIAFVSVPFACLGSRLIIMKKQ